MVVISSLIHPRRIDSRRLNARSVIAALTVLAAARSHSGSDSRLRLSFIALVPLRYVQGCRSPPSPFESRLQNKRGEFEFSRLDDARSGSALTVSLRLGHTRVLTAVQGCHSLPSCRFATPQAPHSLPSPFESPLPKQKGHRWCPFCFGAPRGIRTLDLPVRSRALYPLSYGRIFSSARIVYHNVLRLSIVKTKILKEKIFIFCAIAIVIYNIFCYNTSVYLKR